MGNKREKVNSAERVWSAPVFQNLLLPSYRILFQAYSLKEPPGVYISTERVPLKRQNVRSFSGTEFWIKAAVKTAKMLLRVTWLETNTWKQTSSGMIKNRITVSLNESLEEYNRFLYSKNR